MVQSYGARRQATPQGYDPSDPTDTRAAIFAENNRRAASHLDNERQVTQRATSSPFGNVVNAFTNTARGVNRAAQKRVAQAPRKGVSKGIGFGKQPMPQQEPEQRQDFQPSYQFTPFQTNDFNFGDFSYKGPSVDEILSQLLDQYGGTFDSRTQNLESRRDQALEAIGQSYEGTARELERSHEAVDDRYEKRSEASEEQTENAQETLAAGGDDAAQRQAQMAKVLGIEDAMVNNPGAESDARYYAARLAENAQADQQGISSDQGRDFRANENAISSAALEAPQVQADTRSNYDSALAELDDLRQQFEMSAYQQALGQYNTDRSQQLSEWNSQQQNAFNAWNANNQNAYQNWAAEQQYLQGQDDRAYQESVRQDEMDFAAAQAAYEAEMEGAQPTDLGDYASYEDILQHNLQQAGVSPEMSKEWYGRLQNHVGSLPEGDNKLSAQEIHSLFGGSHQAESYLVDYARKMGYLS